MLKQFVKASLRKLGYEIRVRNFRQSHDLRKTQLLHDLAIDLVIDAGANVGQFAEHMRSLGYKGRIVSLEPVPEVFRLLNAKTSQATGWESHNVALGEKDGEAVFNVHGNSELSSFLKTTSTIDEITGKWPSTSSQTVQVRSLDSLMPEISRGSERIYLKMDIQGYERQALIGSVRTLADVLALELEVSTIPLYHGEWLLPEMLQQTAQNGFAVFSIEPLLVNQTSGRVVSLEVLLKRDHSTESTVVSAN